MAETMDVATTGTHRLIRSVQAWVERKYGKTDFYLAQFLTGHGCFREYLYKYGHDDETNCSFCGNSVENALHIFFSCQRYAIERADLENLTMEPVIPVRLMTESKLVSDRVRAWCAIALQELRRNEWQRNESRRMNEEYGRKA